MLCNIKKRLFCLFVLVYYLFMSMWGVSVSVPKTNYLIDWINILHHCCEFFVFIFYLVSRQWPLVRRTHTRFFEIECYRKSVQLKCIYILFMLLSNKSKKLFPFKGWLFLDEALQGLWARKSRWVWVWMWIKNKTQSEDNSAEEGKWVKTILCNKRVPGANLLSL